MKKIYDCFCYFNEELILKLRMETLWEHVDFFVIVESRYTISGSQKLLHFEIEKFKKYKSKIRHLIVNDYPFDLSDPWKNERFQRNYIEKGLYDAKPNDWIIISDVDEIPDPEKIALFNPSQYIRGDFEQKFYSYYLNNLCFEKSKPLLWQGSKITTYENFRDFFSSAESVRNYKSSGLLRGIKRWIFRKYQVQTIKDGGWHFSWMGGIEKIIEKLESFAHQEFNTPEYKNPSTIADKLKSGIDILNPNRNCKIQEINSSFPDYLVKNKLEFKKLIL